MSKLAKWYYDKDLEALVKANKLAYRDAVEIANSRIAIKALGAWAIVMIIALVSYIINT